MYKTVVAILILAGAIFWCGAALAGSVTTVTIPVRLTAHPPAPQEDKTTTGGPAVQDAAPVPPQDNSGEDKSRATPGTGAAAVDRPGYYHPAPPTPRRQRDRNRPAVRSYIYYRGSGGQPDEADDASNDPATGRSRHKDAHTGAQRTDVSPAP